MTTNSDDSREDSGAQSSRQPFPSSGSAAYDSVDVTPAKKMGANEFAEHEPVDRNSHRQRLVRDLQGREEQMSFLRLMDILGLGTAHDAHNKSIPINAFNAFANDSDF
ncbi:hypothetical protein IWW47_002631, partial [Coemansia sp. RSA 2052]